MNIFEDLIEELKEENLLEETVIETNNDVSENTYSQPFKPHSSPVSVQTESFQDQSSSNEDTSHKPVSEDLFQPALLLSNETPVNETPEEFSNYDTFETDIPKFDSLEQPDEAIAFKGIDPEAQFAEANEIDSQFVQNFFQQNDTMVENIIREEEGLLNAEDLIIGNPVEESIGFDVLMQPENPLVAKEVTDDNTFFRRRATEEVNSLQIVEHIISAIEREQMKIMPKPYDDLSVSMALHDFLKVTEKPNSLEHAQAEFKLMQETESWYSALSQRDKHVSVGDLRKYCENTRPALSSQALISLARFYRNSPFSEVVRSKFDMVMTRLLTKEMWNDTREMIFTRDELIKQISNLYADWSSIPLYESNEDDSDVLIGVLKFEDFANEANVAETFDELIKNDFFNRLKIYKESTGEKFFSPLLVATVIESNVVIGNKYVKLIQQEREKNNGKLLEEKYSFLLDQSVSDATSKTLQLVEVLKEKKEVVKGDGEPLPEIKEVVVVESSKKTKVFDDKSVQKLAPRVNKALVAFALVALVFLGGLYIWAEYLSTESKPANIAPEMSLDDSPLRVYFKTARINKETLFVITEPIWDQSSKEVKEDVLKKALTVGVEKGFTKVHVLDSEGKTLAFASEQGLTLGSN